MLPNKTDKTLTFTDKNSNTFHVNLDELLQKPDKTESTNAAGDKVITVKDGSKTYEIITTRRTSTPMHRSRICPPTSWPVC